MLAPTPVLAERLMARDSFCDMDFPACDGAPLAGRTRAFSASCGHHQGLLLYGLQGGTSLVGHRRAFSPPLANTCNNSCRMNAWVQQQYPAGQSNANAVQGTQSCSAPYATQQLPSMNRLPLMRQAREVRT